LKESIIITKDHACMYFNGVGMKLLFVKFTMLKINYNVIYSDCPYWT